MINIHVLKNQTFTADESVPKSATPRSTGKDVRTTSEPEIVGVKHNSDGSGPFWKSIDYIQYRTNLFVAPQLVSLTPTWVPPTEKVDYDILAFPRSSISKYNLVLANSVGLVDSDYRNEILLRFKYIWQPEDLVYVLTSGGNVDGISSIIVGKVNVDKIYKLGDAVAQLKVTKIENVKFIIVDELDKTARVGGFGSTDGVILPDHLAKLYESRSTPNQTTKKYSNMVAERE